MTWRNVLGMLLLVLGCGVVLLWMQDDGASGPARPDGIVESFVKGDVTKLTLTGEGIEIVTRRRPGVSDAWDLQIGTEWARADAVQIDEILNAVIRADVIQSFPRAEVTDAQRGSFGLDKPSATFELAVPGGTRTARFGDRTREGTGVYVDRGPGTDVLIVATAPQDQINAALQGGVRDHHISDLRTYDVKTLEIVRGGVTTLEATKDITQIWRITQPFKGYADPTLIETRVSHIVNEQWQISVDEGVKDLPRYGLAQPEADVTLTSKRDEVRTIHIGKEVGDDGTRYAKEEGYGTVFIVSKRFIDALFGDAMDIRDRAFARLGLGQSQVTVRIEDTSYTLRKAHSEWEVETPTREPAEESVVQDYLEQIRQWRVVEFLDGENPVEYGCTPDGAQIQITSGEGSLTTYLIGNEAADGTYYAQRKDDGQLVKVMAGPIQTAKAGWLQFKRRSGLELVPEDIVFIGRDGGTADGADVTDAKWRRDLTGVDKRWKAEIGQPGSGLDATAMNRMLEALRSVRPLEWRHWDASKNAEMGFRDDGGAADTAWLEIDFRDEANRGPVNLLIGKKLADQDAYYVRVLGKDYVMVVDADTVGRLTAPLMAR